MSTISYIQKIFYLITKRNLFSLGCYRQIFFFHSTASRKKNFFSPGCHPKNNFFFTRLPSQKKFFSHLAAISKKLFSPGCLHYQKKSRLPSKKKLFFHPAAIGKKNMRAMYRILPCWKGYIADVWNIYMYIRVHGKKFYMKKMKVKKC